MCSHLLSITQNKTKVKLRFAVAGKLKEILDRRSKTSSTYLFCTSTGKSLRVEAMRDRFAKLKLIAIAKNPDLKEELSTCQFRDLRAKSGTDTFLQSDDPEAAQRQLGHTSQSMTKRYIRKDKILLPLDELRK
ncbi:tyrosine-type recombinase/integrase [Neisseriaceae bacterium CLB008]